MKTLIDVLATVGSFVLFKVLFQHVFVDVLAELFMHVMHPWVTRTERQITIMLHYDERHPRLTPKRCTAGKCHTL